MVCLHFHISEHPLLYIALSCLDITGAVWVWELPAIWGACSACFLFCHSSGCKMDEPFRTSSCSFATSATVIPDCTLDLKWSGNRESCCTPVMTGCLLVVHDWHPGPGHLEKYNSGSSEHGVPGNVKAHLRLGKVLGSVVALTVGETSADVNMFASMYAELFASEKNPLFSEKQWRSSWDEVTSCVCLCGIWHITVPRRQNFFHFINKKNWNVPLQKSWET